MDDETLWVGIDLGSEAHQVCVLDAHRKVVLERVVKHSGAAVTALLDELLVLAKGCVERIRVALETPQSAVVEMLMDRGISTYTINPKQLDRFRDRHSVAGAKDDRRDAFVLGDSLSTDLQLFRQVKLAAGELVELKGLTRMRDELQTDANALSNRIEAELLRCFPEFRSLGSIQSDAWLLDLLQLGPTPAQARKLRLSQVRAVLKTNKIRKHTAEHVHALLHGPSVFVAPGVAESSATHILLLIARLRLVREQEGRCRKDMQRLLDKLSEPEPDAETQRDAAIVTVHGWC
jgi:hypothetical protein